MTLLAFTPDGKTLVAANKHQEPTVRIFDVERRLERHQFTRESTIRQLAVSLNSTHASGGRGSAIRQPAHEPALPFSLGPSHRQAGGRIAELERCLLRGFRPRWQNSCCGRARPEIASSSRPVGCRHRKGNPPFAGDHARGACARELLLVERGLLRRRQVADRRLQRRYHPANRHC
jgi:hypothetical protein